MTEPAGSGRDATKVAGALTPDTGSDDEFSFLDLAIVVAKYKKMILGLPLIAAIVAALVSYLITPQFTATARILPPQQSQSTVAAMLGQLGALAGLAGASVPGLKNPAELYVGMFKSRTVADALIERFKLKELYGQQTLQSTRKQLESRTVIVAGRDGILTLSVDDADPKRAAAMANAYVEELDRLSNTLAITDAALRRVFFEKQLALSKDSLAEAEIALKKTQEATGLIKLDDQGRAIIESVARMRAEIAAREVELTAMRTFATEKNPDYVRIQQQLVGLRVQLARLETNNVSGRGDVLVPTGKVPEAGLEYLRRFRDMKYQEAIFEVLAKQYEIARIEEAKDAAVIQVVDRAVVPETKSKPRRALIVLVTALAVGVLAVLWAFSREALERIRREPAYAQRLQVLRGHLTKE